MVNPPFYPSQEGKCDPDVPQPNCGIYIILAPELRSSQDDRDRLTLTLDPSPILWRELCLPLPTVR